MFSFQSSFASGEFDGSTTSYTFNIDSTSDTVNQSGSICGSIIIPASLCDDEILCNLELVYDHVLTYCNKNLSHVILTVHASNVLGDGPPSAPVVVGM